MMNGSTMGTTLGVTILLAMSGGSPVQAGDAPFWWGPIYVDYDSLDFLNCDDHDVVYEYPDGEFVVSSHDDPATGFQAEVATSFVAGPCPITRVGCRGAYLDHPTVPADLRVRLYDDDGGRPGALIDDWTSLDPDEVLGAPYFYCTSPPGPVALTQGERYWVSIVAIQTGDTRWGLVGGVSDETTAFVRSDTLILDDWTPLSEVIPCARCDVALTLWVDDDCDLTPVDHGSWSTLKLRYE